MIKQPYLQDTYTSTSDTVLQALALGQTKFEEIIAEHERPVRSYTLFNIFIEYVHIQFVHQAHNTC
jgi:hypothetical protein